MKAAMHISSLPFASFAPSRPIAWRRTITAGITAAFALFAGAAAQAQNVALAGMLGKTPLLVVDGAPPKAVPIGQSHMGVKVLSVEGEQVQLLNEGKRISVRLVQAPVSVGGATAAGGQDDAVQGDARRIVLSQSGGGHFSGSGSINGKAMRFVVDTGATYVSLGVNDAERLGIKYKDGARAPMQTANGISLAWRVKLNSVRIGSVQLHAVDAVVVPSTMSQILLGNSFLNRFAMTRNGDQMVLERRY